MKIFKKYKAVIIILIICLLYSCPIFAQYTWHDKSDSSESIAGRIKVPENYKRVGTKPDSFAGWLRNLPLKEGKPPILYYNGTKKFNQLANYAVVDIDVGEKDLQQCADAVIRLRAEYFYSKGQYDSIAFNFTSGDRFRYNDWLDGLTPVVDRNDVGWDQMPERENTRRNFNEYLEIIFTYAGSYSLSKELEKVRNLTDMRIGDIFIEGGFPGHAVIVVDMAENIETRGKIFILAQSYMPAQNIHIIKNPLNWILSPWYELDFGKKLYTLEWVFEKDELMRFK